MVHCPPRPNPAAKHLWFAHKQQLHKLGHRHLVDMLFGLFHWFGNWKLESTFKGFAGTHQSGTVKIIFLAGTNQSGTVIFIFAVAKEKGFSWLKYFPNISFCRRLKALSWNDSMLKLLAKTAKKNQQPKQLYSLDLLWTWTCVWKITRLTTASAWRVNVRNTRTFLAPRWGKHLGGHCNYGMVNGMTGRLVWIRSLAWPAFHWSANSRSHVGLRDFIPLTPGRITFTRSNAVTPPT